MKQRRAGCANELELTLVEERLECGRVGLKYEYVVPEQLPVAAWNVASVTFSDNRGNRNAAVPDLLNILNGLAGEW
jgi:hypothetical protein